MQGLNHNEVRTISEKVQEQPEHNNEREKRVEFREAFKKKVNIIFHEGALVCII